MFDGKHVSLKEYREKRDFRITPEPAGSVSKSRSKRSHSPIYVIHKHQASRLHYDLRLEHKGVLLSWAVPKGPSLDPSVKRLAIQVEDHPLEYAKFEGVIPEGQYGAGTVMVWDIGTWVPQQKDVGEAVKNGELKFVLLGKKLRGSWVLVRTRGYGRRAGKSSWLLIKHRDEYASKTDITAKRPRSALTGRLLADIARDEGGDVARARMGDPPHQSAMVRGGARSSHPL
jgi:bifunctional non-homologous end joining protein LigD